jgi:hypothetical protein
MTVEEVLTRRGVDELLHFTTNVGATGILGDGEVLPRSRLPNEKHLANVYPPNSRIRYDVAHLDYVNLSITRINQRFFASSTNWHRDEDVWWCVLSFDPVIAAHEGVQFSSTNNRYTGCRHFTGGDGLEALFGPRIHQYASKWATRAAGIPANWPTDRQAEVLYPGALSTDFLRRIYVASNAHHDVIATNADIYGRDVTVEVRPGVFT